MNQKHLWDTLARTDARYFINSDFGKKITEREFIKSGMADYNRLIRDDKLLPKGGTILEIGCGTGRMTAFMKFHYKKVIGTDISKEMIRQGNERLYLDAGNMPEVTLYETDGETLPVPDNSVNVVFSYLVFQHIKDRIMVVRNFEEAYRVLVSGGIFKVRLRTDDIKDMNRWWAGVNYSPETAKYLYSPLGFHLVKLEMVEHYGMWLWLKK